MIILSILSGVCITHYNETSLDDSGITWYSRHNILMQSFISNPSGLVYIAQLCGKFSLNTSIILNFLVLYTLVSSWKSAKTTQLKIIKGYFASKGIWTPSHAFGRDSNTSRRVGELCSRRKGRCLVDPEAYLKAVGVGIQQAGWLEGGHLT